MMKILFRSLLPLIVNWCIVFVISSCNNSNCSKVGSTTHNFKTKEEVKRDKPINIPIKGDSLFSIELVPNKKFENEMTIILKKNGVPIYFNDDSRNGVGNMVNYNKRNDSVYFANPVLVDSFVIFVTNSYSNQVCNIININNKNQVLSLNTTYFYFINDLSRKSIIFFKGDKMKFWENDSDLAEVFIISYNKNKTGKIYVPFRKLMESYNSFSSGKIDRTGVLEIVSKYSN